MLKASLYSGRFIYTLISKAIYILRTRKQQTQFAYQLLQQFEQQQNGTFNTDTKKEIAVSHGIYLPMICDSFLQLLGRKCTPTEQAHIVHYFTCSSLFDDFVDEKQLTWQQLFAISYAPENYIANSFEERTFLYAHRYLLDIVRNKEAYLADTKILFEAQKNSQLQIHGQLSEPLLTQTTLNKGGYSLRICNYYFADEGMDEQLPIWEKLGNIIQVINDLFDVWKDVQNQTVTPANNAKNIHELTAWYRQLVDALWQEMQAIKAPSHKVTAFKISMAGICAFGFIAIDQFRLLADADGRLHWQQYTRKQLIIDMEKWNNLVSWCRHTYKLGKKA
ncbi:MAG: hypothetical protein EAY68_08695 [Bacteroidetes bacterium]|nr:MAG: hypothetical protein EAY68_08695 [Bacteroidota bacterium]